MCETTRVPRHLIEMMFEIIAIFNEHLYVMYAKLTHFFVTSMEGICWPHAAE